MKDCEICYENKDLDEFKTLSCTHELCIECYNQLIISKCPYCRKPFANEYQIQQQENQIEIENDIDFDFNTLFDYNSDNDIEYINELITSRSYRRLHRRNNINRRPPRINLLRQNITPIQIINFDNHNPINDNPNDNLSISQRKNKRKSQKRVKRNELIRNRTSNTWISLQIHSNSI